MSSSKKESISLDLTQAADRVGNRVSAETLRKAIACGELRGRNIGGSVGWLTTEDALTEWIESGNGKRAIDEAKS